MTELAQALEGRVEAHHRFLLAMQIRRLAQADGDVKELDEWIDEKLEPYREAHDWCRPHAPVVG